MQSFQHAVSNTHFYFFAFPSDLLQQLPTSYVCCESWSSHYTIDIIDHKYTNTVVALLHSIQYNAIQYNAFPLDVVN